MNDKNLQSEIEKLKAEIDRLKRELKKRKKYGLVWEEKPEEVVDKIGTGATPNPTIETVKK